MYNTIIFDLDGTLIDSDYFNMSSLQKAIKNIEGRALSFDEVKKVSGTPGFRTLELLNVTQKEEVLEEWDAEFFRQRGKADFFDDMESVLAKLKQQGAYLGIVTSREAHEYDAFFSHLGLYDKFETIVFASDTENHKPHPEPLFKFFEISGRDKMQAIYIGDTVYDRDTAKNAGIDFALAGWSLHDVPCEKVLKRPRDILRLMD